MRRVAGVFCLLAFAACEPISKREPHGKQADLRVDELRENAIPSATAEPPWRDLIRHTAIPQPGRAIHPAASRDGKLVAYASTEFGPTFQIALRRVDGIAPAQMTRNGAENLFPRISPDGRLLAYASNKTGNWDLFVTRIDAPLTATQLTFEAEDDISPSWSHDGKSLAYCSRRPGDLWQIVLVDVGTRLKTYLGAGVYPDWSPDAADPWICFQSQPRAAGGRTGVWAVRPDGTGLREVVSDKAHAWSAFNPRFSPDGKWIAYATALKSVESRIFGEPDQTDDIWIVRPDGTLDTRLTEDLSPEGWPSWGGHRVFFTSIRDGDHNVYSVQVKPLEDRP